MLPCKKIKKHTCGTVLLLHMKDNVDTWNARSGRKHGEDGRWVAEGGTGELTVGPPPSRWRYKDRKTGRTESKIPRSPCHPRPQCRRTRRRRSVRGLTWWAIASPKATISFNVHHPSAESTRQRSFCHQGAVEAKVNQRRDEDLGCRTFTDSFWQRATFQSGAS